MQISDFDFDFPSELIADRTAGKGRTQILQCNLHNDELEIIASRKMVECFKPGDCLVVNNTKVLPARLFGQKKSGGRVEILLVNARPDLGDTVWESWVKPGKAFKLGNTLSFGSVEAAVQQIHEDGSRVLQFNCSSEEFLALLYESGKVPLPPYIRREADQQDLQDYQTVFARHLGAVAAPTASLHFSEEMLEDLKDRGVKIAEVTLHVGPGTFQNVSVEKIEDHKMHGEAYNVEACQATIINDCKKQGGRIISVGTTSTRVLETATDQSGLLLAGQGVTHAYIYPGYHFKMIDGLLTNFHWPKSTLVMLVSALYGREKTLRAYRYAVENKLKLFSYGDGMLIL